MRRRAVAVLLVALLALGAVVVILPGPARAGAVPRPTLTVPPAGLRGHALWDSYFDLGPFGYEEQELFVSGTATDAGGTPASYTTRIIVTRPSDPADFNGTVLLDWVNVTAQFENAVDTMLAREMLLREGFAYVHVSAQQAGLCCVPGLTPKLWDPVRYAAIDHPGDAWAFDMFTQVARVFETPVPPGGVDPMGAVGVGAVRNVLAVGQSQSGIRLHDYLQEWLPAHPEAAGVIDGVLVHGDVGQPKTFGPPLTIPVLQLLSDFEAVEDGVDPADLDPNQRLWEVAGTSHADLFIGYQSVFGHGPRVLVGVPPVSRPAFRSIIDTAGNYGERIDPLLLACVVAGAGMPMRYAASAALYHLATWADGGPAPPHGPRFTFANGQLARDEHGNARGGIRLPPIDVPVARYESTLCALGGITIPFLDPQLHALYPTHADYYGRMAERSDAAVAGGWLLPDDAVDLMRRACAARVRWPGAGACAPYDPPTFAVALPSTATDDGEAGPPPPPPSPPSPAGADPPPSADPAPTTIDAGDPSSNGRGPQRLPATGAAPALGLGAVLLGAALAVVRLLRRPAPMP